MEDQAQPNFGKDWGRGEKKRKRKEKKKKKKKKKKSKNKKKSQAPTQPTVKGQQAAPGALDWRALGIAGVL